MFSLLSQHYMNSHVNTYAFACTTHYIDYPRVLSVRDVNEVMRKGATTSQPAEVAAERGTNILMMSRRGIKELKNIGRLLLIETGSREGKSKFLCESVVVCLHVHVCTYKYMYVYKKRLMNTYMYSSIYMYCVSMLYVHVYVHVHVYRARNLIRLLCVCIRPYLLYLMCVDQHF